MKRLVAVLGVVLLFVFAAYLSAGLTEFPAAVVCDRGRPNVEVSSTAPFGQAGCCGLWVEPSATPARITG